jgi:hypothetical protein
MLCICRHDEEEHAEEAGCRIKGCLCIAYRRTEKGKKIKRLVAKINALQEQCNEISKEINELNARLRRIATFDEWYEGKGIDGGITDSTHDAMNIFWDAAADQVRYYACDYDDNVEPDFDPSPEQVFVTCLLFLYGRVPDDSPSGPVLKIVDAIEQVPCDKLFRVEKK